MAFTSVMGFTPTECLLCLDRPHSRMLLLALLHAAACPASTSQRQVVNAARVHGRCRHTAGRRFCAACSRLHASQSCGSYRCSLALLASRLDLVRAHVRGVDEKTAAKAPGGVPDASAAPCRRELKGGVAVWTTASLETHVTASSMVVVSIRCGAGIACRRF